MITRYDYISIIFYLVFVVVVGMVFSRRNKNTSDYFRGGGIMPWWMAGISAWMASFSAWTFTGAAGEIYVDGPYVLVAYYANIASYLTIFLFTCYRFRRMRSVTPVEAIRARYGAATQQFVTWVRLPILLFFGGIALNNVGVFMSGAFGIHLQNIIITLGLMVTFVSLVGGAFGVAASDFVQAFLVVTVTLVISAFALLQPSVGGFSGLLHKLPAADFHWSLVARPQFILLYFLGLTFNNIFAYNSIEMSAKYLMAKSDSHARKMALFPLLGTVIGPLLWMIPAMVTSVTHPGSLANLLPTLNHPNEGAFLVTAHDVLPVGMLGMLVAGIFGAVGILVRNFYLPVINPKCSEKKLLIISKLCTGAFGLLIVQLGLIISHHRTAGLFDLLNQLGVALYLPLAIPMCLGLFIKRTPPWAGWSTVLAGLIATFSIMFCIKPQITLDPASTSFITHFQIWVGIHGMALPTLADLSAWIPGMGGTLTAKEIVQAQLIVTAFGVITVGGLWYFFTTLFYERSPADYKANVEEFFARLKHPIEGMTAEQVKENTKVVGSIGGLCLIFGAFILLMMLVPNDGSKRLGFLFSGGCFIAVGWLLRRVAKRGD
jgi:Na+/proline symporter